MITEEQMQWASKHDWYVGHGVNADNVLFVRIKQTVWRDTGLKMQTLDFTSFTRLIEWKQSHDASI